MFDIRSDPDRLTLKITFHLVESVIGATSNVDVHTGELDRQVKSVLVHKIL